MTWPVTVMQHKWSFLKKHCLNIVFIAAISIFEFINGIIIGFSICLLTVLEKPSETCVFRVTYVHVHFKTEA